MEGKTNLRKLERLILSRLDFNSRAPFSRFGGKIKTSQQQISYTVNSLKHKGIIQNFYTLIDYSKLDILNFRVYFKVSYISEQKLGELIDYLVSEQHTSWVAACGGKYDLVCTFLALNPSQFNKTLREIMEKFPEQIKNYTVLTTVVNRIFGRKYLSKDSPIVPEIILGGDREPEEIDSVDMNILNELSEDARKNSVLISNKLSLASKTVINRIKKLQKRKIIRGFKPLLNLQRAGYNSNLLMIKYHNISSELEDELINYLKMHASVISVVKTLGEWDIEIEIEAEEEKEIRKVEVEIRQKFA
ncbi:AsnC family transcriptional regulator, partial [Candidatus Woesearchaeota archaeon]|nr:AsnC family transcriptional regulator [Candidatus Woesearchaeota archaeon]